MEADGPLLAFAQTPFQASHLKVNAISIINIISIDI